MLDVLDEDEQFGPGRATPDHYVHVSPVGNGSPCPATEPEETGLHAPWPGRQARDTEDKQDVSVVVVDTGWRPAAAVPNGPTPWLAGVNGDDENPNKRAELWTYAGHGTFIAGVVRCFAPHTTVFVEGFAINGRGGGAILESDMVAQLDDALTHNPQVINLSAGCRTRDDHPSVAFQEWHKAHEDWDGVLVAAAGNDSSPAPFWPAAFPWAVGVGSLDRNGRVSSFSNHCKSADVYALGRNVVNAFPDGPYKCHETPHKGDLRNFGTGMARWSGTSFAAPVVAGMIAAEIRSAGVDAKTAWKNVRARTVRLSDPAIGAIRACVDYVEDDGTAVRLAAATARSTQ